MNRSSGMMSAEPSDVNALRPILACMLITAGAHDESMARTEQIVTDRKTMRELVEFMEEAVREGLTKEEIASQVDLMLDGAARGRLERSLKEARSGKVRRFKNADEMIAALHKD